MFDQNIFFMVIYFVSFSSFATTEFSVCIYYNLTTNKQYNRLCLFGQSFVGSRGPGKILNLNRERLNILREFSVFQFLLPFKTIYSDDVTENGICSFDKSFLLKKSRSFDKVSNLTEKHWKYLLRVSNTLMQQFTQTWQKVINKWYNIVKKVTFVFSARVSLCVLKLRLIRDMHFTKVVIPNENMIFHIWKSCVKFCCGVEVWRDTESVE